MRQSNSGKKYVVISDDDDVAGKVAEAIKIRGHTVRTAKMLQPESDNGIIFVKRTDVYPNEAWTLARFCDAADLAFVVALKGDSTDAICSHLKFLGGRNVGIVAVLGEKGARAVATVLAVVPENNAQRLSADTDPRVREEKEFGKSFFTRGSPRIMVTEPVADACGTENQSPAGTSPLDLVQ
ncbi:MAG: hypothetical protein Q7S75_02035 [bacterium]|nr:hypothetical protein [bacterium]